VFAGNYEDYLWRKEGKGLEQEQGSKLDARRKSHSGENQAAQLDGVREAVSEQGQVQTQTSTAQDSATAGPEASRSAAKRLNPVRLRLIEQRCHELEEEIACCEAEVRSYDAELIHFRSAEESIRVTKLLEDGRTELA